MERPNSPIVNSIIFFLLGGIPFGLAQTSNIQTAAGEIVSISQLSLPIYPQLARQARITGDVVLALQIRQNGTLESVQLVSGHPILKDAAVDSAKKSEFQCRDCKEELTSFSLIYTFGFSEEEACCRGLDGSADAETPQKQPDVTRSNNHITVVAQPLCICDPPAELRKVRSAKCLYRWRCRNQ